MNKSGHTGITWNKKAQTWIINKESKYLGCFKDIDDAIECKNKIKRKSNDTND